MMYTKMDDEFSIIDYLELTLNMRHLCPTAPDTLRAYPFKETDPFIIKSCPQVYFAGNQEAYQEKLITEERNESHMVKLISIPNYRTTKGIVLLDLQTLQSYYMEFGSSDGLMPQKDSAGIDNDEDMKMDID